MTVYIADMSLWPEISRICGDYFFREHRPASTIVPAAKLHYGYAVEMDGIAELV